MTMKRYHAGAKFESPAETPSSQRARARTEHSLTELSLPSHPPPSAVHCRCRSRPLARSFQVKDENKGTLGKFFCKCNTANCDTWECGRIPPAKEHWPYVLGEELPPGRTVLCGLGVDCCHPLEQLKGMGGFHAALMCSTGGGRWKKGSAARLVLSREKSVTKTRVRTQGMEEVSGEFLRKPPGASAAEIASRRNRTEPSEPPTQQAPRS